MPVNTASDLTFGDLVLKATRPVLTMFGNDWCGPSRSLTVTLNVVAAGIGSEADIALVDCDRSPESATRHGIRGVPTTILFDGGEPVATKLSSLPQAQLLKWLEDEFDRRRFLRSIRSGKTTRSVLRIAGSDGRQSWPASLCAWPMDMRRRWTVARERCSASDAR